MKRDKFDFKHLNEAVIAELDRMRDNLREKGDHYHASKVERFKQEYFVEPASSVTDEVPTRRPRAHVRRVFVATKDESVRVKGFGEKRTREI